MDLSREFLFFFSALGAFNGLLLSAWFLFFVRPRHPANYFLGGMLGALSVRVGKSVIFFFYPDLDYIFLQLGVSVCVFIGPCLYGYLHLLVRGRAPRGWYYHFVALLLLVVVVGVLFPFATCPGLWTGWIIYFFYSVWGAYLLASGYLLRDNMARLWRDRQSRNSVDVWVLSIFWGNVIVWMAYLLWFYTSYIVGALSFSFLTYLLILLLYFYRERDFLRFRRQPKYGQRKIETAEATPLLARLDRLMEERELFLRPNLTLAELAGELRIVPHRLSQLLNDNLGQSFPHYLNARRIERAKALLTEDTKFSLEGVGYECGFNSKSTFYSAFKRHTGMTPASYRKRHRTGGDS